MTDRWAKVRSLRIVRRWRRKNEATWKKGIVCYAPYIPLQMTPDVVLGYKGEMTLEEGIVDPHVLNNPPPALLGHRGENELKTPMLMLQEWLGGF